jgi:hypothetical protein
LGKLAELAEFVVLASTMNSLLNHALSELWSGFTQLLTKINSA